VKSIALLFALALPCAARLPEPVAWQYVNAIYRIEGGDKTRHPYGVLGKFTNPRQVCYNTVQNTHTRWLKAGQPGAFNAYLAQRYCPVGASNDPHNLNANWLTNLNQVLKTK
jgi:hypothetical protein